LTNLVHHRKRERVWKVKYGIDTQSLETSALVLAINVTFDFLDTIEVMAGYVDCVVLRHPSPEALAVHNLTQFFTRDKFRFN
jgi:aspartate carbamoyltransferase catalytic subunit